MVSISPYTKGIVETLIYRDPMIRRLLENEISHLVEQFHRTVTNGNLADGVRTLTLIRFNVGPIQDDTYLTAALLLSLRNLKRLSVLCIGATLAPPAVDPSCRFTNITHLSWCTEVEDTVCFATFLASLPSLEYMEASGERIGSVPLATSALPLLRHLYQCSLDFATSVLEDRTVAHLDLVEIDDRLPLSLILGGGLSSTSLPTLKYLQSLSLTSNGPDPIAVLELAYLC